MACLLAVTRRSAMAFFVLQPDFTVARRIAVPRTQHGFGLAGAGVDFAQHSILVGQDAVVIGRAAEQHGAGGHQAALGPLDDFKVAGTAGITRGAIVRRVDETHKLRGFAVEQGIAALGVGRRREVPAFREHRQHVGIIAQLDVIGVGRCQPARRDDLRIAAVAIGAAQHDRFGRVHRRFIAGGVAADAAGGLGSGQFRRLPFRRRPGMDTGVIPRHRLFAFGREGHADQWHHQKEEQALQHVNKPEQR